MNNFIGEFLGKLRENDWTLVKGSTLISIGTAVARILGLAFSLVLAAVFTSGEYGEVRYSIAVASIVAIIAMPFGQHVLARFVGKYKNDDSRLNSILTNAGVILPGLFLLTLAVTVPVLLVMHKFNIGIIAIFFGETLFYAYWGLTSGFLEARRLTAAYLGSNLIQILLVFLLIKALGIHSTTLGLLIYGLSYLLPLAILMIFWPLPGKVHRQYLDLKVMGELLRFSIPIWISHACFTFSVTFDFLFLERLGNESLLGAYSLSKTLASMFIIIPSGISTLLMPKVASSSQKNHRQTLLRMVFITLAIDAIGLLIYLPLAQPLTARIFGRDYVVAVAVSLLLALYMILYGIHGLISAVFVGRGTPQFESVSRIAELVVTGLGCFFLVPIYNAIGAAVAMLSGKLAALMVYGLMLVPGIRISQHLTNIFSFASQPDTPSDQSQTQKE